MNQHKSHIRENNHKTIHEPNPPKPPQSLQGENHPTNFYPQLTPTSNKRTLSASLFREGETQQQHQNHMAEPTTTRQGNNWHKETTWINNTMTHTNSKHRCNKNTLQQTQKQHMTEPSKKRTCWIHQASAQGMCFTRLQPKASAQILKSCWLSSIPWVHILHTTVVAMFCFEMLWLRSTGKSLHTGSAYE